MKNQNLYVVAKKFWDYECRDSKRDYFNLRWNLASEDELQETGISHTRNNYYNEGAGVTFGVYAYSQKEAIRKVRKYVKKNNYPVFNGLDSGTDTDYVSLRIKN